VISIFVRLITLASGKRFEFKGPGHAGAGSEPLLRNRLLCNRFFRMTVTNRAKIEITPRRSLTGPRLRSIKPWPAWPRMRA